MKRIFRFRAFTMLASGLVLLQIGGCTFSDVNSFFQTILLGVTAAGAVAIIQNI